MRRMLPMLLLIAPALAGPPLPDRDGDRRITVLDYRLFQNEFAAKLPGGDANADGAWNIHDFSAFMNNVAEYQAAGWSPITADPGLRWVHVDSQAGNDLAGGTPLDPLRTIEAAQAKGFDVLALRAGRAWDCVRTIHLSQDRGPTWIVPWGEGPRPQLRFADVGAVDLHGSDVTIIGVSFVCTGVVTDELAQCGIGGVGFSRPMSRLLIEDCEIRGWFKGIVADVFTAPEARDWRIRRSVIADCYQTGSAHAAGAYFAGIDGLLIEECVFDHNGWRTDIEAARPNIFRRNLYVQSNCARVELRGNVFARSGAEGAQVRAGGLAAENLFLLNGVSGLYMAGPAIIRGNAVLDSRNLDANTQRGTGIDAGDVTDGQIIGNVCAHRSTPGTYGILGIVTPHRPSPAFIVGDNAVHDWQWEGVGAAYAIMAPVRFARNHAYAMRNGCVILTPTLDAWPAGLAALNVYGAAIERPVWIEGQGRAAGLSDWKTAAGEIGSDMAGTAAAFPTIGDYAGSLGLPPSLDGFLAAARGQSYADWRPALTGAGASGWFRARAGIAPESR